MVSYDQLSSATCRLGYRSFLLYSSESFHLDFPICYAPQPLTSATLPQRMATSCVSSSLFFHRIIMFKIMNTMRAGEKLKWWANKEEGSLCRLGYSLAVTHLPSLPLFSQHNELGDIKAGTERGRRRGWRREERSVGGRERVRLDSRRGASRRRREGRKGKKKMLYWCAVPRQRVINIQTVRTSSRNTLAFCAATAQSIFCPRGWMKKKQRKKCI